MARTRSEPEPDLTSAVVIHRALREDLRRLTACLDNIGTAKSTGGSWPLPGARIAIGRYTAALLTEIRAHHESQDLILWPVIAATAGQSVDLAPLTDDHQAIERAVRRVGQALDSLSAEPAEQGTPARLRASLGALRDMVEDHIADEDEQVLPAMRRYLSADGYRWCERQIRRNTPLSRRRFSTPWLARHARPAERGRLLAACGWPSLLLLAAFLPGYTRLERQAFERLETASRQGDFSHL
jgi:iron-sulfur cluster repair protein YtfE (RIC family)